jgi:hypothetical protein
MQACRFIHGFLVSHFTNTHSSIGDKVGSLIEQVIIVLSISAGGLWKSTKSVDTICIAMIRLAWSVLIHSAFLGDFNAIYCPTAMLEAEEPSAQYSDSNSDNSDTIDGDIEELKGTEVS